LTHAEVLEFGGARLGVNSVEAERVKVLEREVAPCARTLRDRQLLAEIKRVYWASRSLYGARKVWWHFRPWKRFPSKPGQSTPPVGQLSDERVSGQGSLEANRSVD